MLDLVVVYVMDYKYGPPWQSSACGLGPCPRHHIKSLVIASSLHSSRYLIIKLQRAAFQKALSGVFPPNKSAGSECPMCFRPSLTRILWSRITALIILKTVTREWAARLFDRLRSFVVVPSTVGGNSSSLQNSQGVDERATLELELELIQTQMTQKPMLRAEVYARALRASQNRKEDSV
jgi:hypothetical protein